MIRAVLCDLDGTLIDTPQGIVETLGAVLAQMDAPRVTTAVMRATIGLPLDVALGQLLGVAPHDAQVAVGIASYHALFRELVLPRATELVFPGVVAGLARLHALGFSLAVATNKMSASAEALLQAAELRQWFDIVAGADQVASPKPDPAMAQQIMQRFGCALHDAVMLGDTTHDIIMAQRAGIRVCAVTYGVHDAQTLRANRPDCMVDTFGAAVEQLVRWHQEGSAA